MFEKKEDNYTNTSLNTQIPSENNTNKSFSDKPFSGRPIINGLDEPYQNQYSQQSSGQNLPFNPQQYNSYAAPVKRKSNAKIITAVVAIIAFFLVAFCAVIFFAAPNADEYVEQYEQTGNLSNLIDACDAYDTTITNISDMPKAQEHFRTALADTKAFLRAFPNSECKDYYESDIDAYNLLVADYYFIMIKNGDYDNFISEFIKRMKEVSPSDYYTDSYTFVSCVSDETLPLTQEEKDVVLHGFDMLITMSETDEEKLLNLQEYYDCCESFGLYDKADVIAGQIESIKQ